MYDGCAHKQGSHRTLVLEATNAQWELMDAKAKETVCLHLENYIFFTIIGHTIAKNFWDNLCSTWESKSASSKVFLMKKLS